MGASKENEWVGDLSCIRQDWVASRNASAKAAVEAGDDVDYICWVDDDMFLPPQTFTKLLRSGKDFAAGLAVQRNPPYRTVVFQWQDDKNGFLPLETWQENTLIPLDGCGFGVVVTSTNMLRKIQELPDFEKDGWFNQIVSPRGGKYSEDLSFSFRARRAGIRLWVDTSVTVGHLIGPLYASIANHKAAAAERAGEPSKE
jgi:hypothetical protein